MNASQALLAKPAYQAFPGGRGIRYLGTFSQQYAPITNDDLFYTFQAVTGDGRYYVVALFPVHASFLPNSPRDIPPNEPQRTDYAPSSSYWTETVAKIEGSPDREFQPSLKLLDRLVSSIAIQGGGPNWQPNVDAASLATLACAPGSDDSLAINPLHYLWDAETAFNRRCFPLFDAIPYISANFDVGYEDRLTLNVLIKSRNIDAVKEDVLAWIRSQGVDPSTHKIQWKVAADRSVWDRSAVWTDERNGLRVCATASSGLLGSSECVARTMPSLGASARAVAFFRASGCFLADFRELGTIDVG